MVEIPENTQEPQESVGSTATAIFSVMQSEFSLNSGKVVRINPAKMKDLSTVLRFFETLVKNIPAHELASIIKMVSGLQKAAIARGADPYAIDFQAEIVRMMGVGTGKEIDPESVASEAIDKMGVLLMLVSATIDELPKVVPSFTNLSADEFGELDIDESMMVVGAIFMVNYSFFTQKLRPVLTAFLAGVMRNRLADAAKT